MVNLSEVAKFLNQFLRSDRFPDDPNGIYRASDRPVQRLGLALEPNEQLGQWVDRLQLDALLLHHPWQVDLESLPVDLGLLAYHLSFDETLTLGFNPILAAKLHLTGLEVLGMKHDRPVGMLGNILPRPLEVLSEELRHLFTGLERVQGQGTTITRVAVVGAMTEALVREAYDRGAQLYLTGQFRRVAAPAVEETGLAVVAIGHRRSEKWGLSALTEVLAQQWPGLQIYQFPDVEPSPG